MKSSLLAIWTLVGIGAASCAGSPGGGTDQSAGTGTGGSGDNAGGGGTGGDPGIAADDPGLVTLRRLNRTEYCNTVRDLLGTSLRPCDQFPQDGVTHGFDTVGAGLTTSPLHVEMYEQAGVSLITEILALPAGDPRRAHIPACDDKAQGAAVCASTILRDFGRRAWRRPVTDEDVAPYASLVDDTVKQGRPFNDGLSLGLQGMMMSPQFLFHVELDADPTSVTPHPLDNNELASRLSYALWASMPDDELFAAADSGDLTKPDEFERQLVRMLDSPKARSLVTEFAGQWLNLRNMDVHQVDLVLFPMFDRPLRDSMLGESQYFVEAWLRDELPLTEILTADYSYVNDRMARHYGLSAGTAAYTRTSLGGGKRRGVLTQASILTLTSSANATSPTVRGAWVLNQMLCAKPPDPPQGIPALPAATDPNETLRQRLERHRTAPACAVCHAEMDPIGLGLETFDAIGLERTVYKGGGTIDPAGALPDGQTFSGAVELAGILAADPRFETCLTRGLLTYSMGRIFETSLDDDWVTRILAAGSSAGGGLKGVIRAMVGSPLFRTRRGEGIN